MQVRSAVREVIDELLGQGWDKILLNLSEVTSVDSSGIGELVACTVNLQSKR